MLNRRPISLHVVFKMNIRFESECVRVEEMKAVPTKKYHAASK